MSHAISFFAPIVAGVEAIVIAAMLARRNPVRMLWRKLMNSLAGEREKAAVLQNECAALRERVRELDAERSHLVQQNGRLLSRLENSNQLSESFHFSRD